MKLNNAIINLVCLIVLTVGLVVCLLTSIKSAQIKTLAAVLICIGICVLCCFNIINVYKLVSKNKK